MAARSTIGALAMLVTSLTLAAATAWAAPDVVVRDAGPRKHCETMSVAVVDHGKELTSAGFCSAGGHMSAKLFTIHGKTFVVALTGEQYDDTKNTAYVRVLELNHLDGDSYEFSEIAGVVVSPPAGGSSAPPTYQVVDAKGGAVDVIVDFPPTKDDPDWPAPPKRVSIQLSPVSP